MDTKQCRLFQRIQVQKCGVHHHFLNPVPCCHDLPLQILFVNIQDFVICRKRIRNVEELDEVNSNNVLKNNHVNDEKEDSGSDKDSDTDDDIIDKVEERIKKTKEEKVIEF